MRGHSAYKPTGGVDGWRPAETQVGGVRRLPVIGAMAVLLGAALAGVFGGVPTDLPESAQNQTVPRQQKAVGPETTADAVPGTVDEGLPDGSSWT